MGIACGLDRSLGLVVSCLVLSASGLRESTWRVRLSTDTWIAGDGDFFSRGACDRES